MCSLEMYNRPPREPVSGHGSLPLAKPDHAVLSLFHGFAFPELSLGSSRGAPAITPPQHCSSGTPLLGQLLCRIRRAIALFSVGKACVPSRPLDPPEMFLGEFDIDGSNFT